MTIGFKFVKFTDRCTAELFVVNGEVWTDCEKEHYAELTVSVDCVTGLVFDTTVEQSVECTQPMFEIAAHAARQMFLADMEAYEGKTAA